MCTGGSQKHIDGPHSVKYSVCLDTCIKVSILRIEIPAARSSRIGLIETFLGIIKALLSL